MTRLIVTEESARVARWLRLMGYDTELMPTRPLPELRRRAYLEQRVIVTRNHDVQPKPLFRLVYLNSTALHEQLRQLMKAIPLRVSARQLFTRCDRCNVPIQPIAKPRVRTRVPSYVFARQRRFTTCPVCTRVYWPATHYDRIRTFMNAIGR